jgi:hypothetical protein
MYKKEKIKKFSDRLKQVLVDGLTRSGIVSVINIDPVKNTYLNRVIIISRDFEHLKQSERQDIVWRIVNFNFGYDGSLKISQISTLTHNESIGK